MRKVFCILLCFFFVELIFSQTQILTAAAFFQGVSEKYAQIKDYEAALKITIGKNDMFGKVSFKRPNLLRIDFTKPAEQVIVFNGDLLTIYLPSIPAILNQTVTSSNSTTGAATLVTPQGLTLLSRYYSISYETGQTPVSLDNQSAEQVVKLVLYRKNTTEGFRSIKISVAANTQLIRRMEATSTNDELFIFDFENYALNQNIPDTRFIYDAPSSANNFNNFLFTD